MLLKAKRNAQDTALDQREQLNFVPVTLFRLNRIACLSPWNNVPVTLFLIWKLARPNRPLNHFQFTHGKYHPDCCLICAAVQNKSTLAHDPLCRFGARRLYADWSHEIA